MLAFASLAWKRAEATEHYNPNYNHTCVCDPIYPNDDCELLDRCQNMHVAYIVLFSLGAAWSLNCVFWKCAAMKIRWERSKNKESVRSFLKKTLSTSFFVAVVELVALSLMLTRLLGLNYGKNHFSILTFAVLYDQSTYFAFAGYLLIIFLWARVYHMSISRQMRLNWIGKLVPATILIIVFLIALIGPILAANIAASTTVRKATTISIGGAGVLCAIAFTIYGLRLIFIMKSVELAKGSTLEKRRRNKTRVIFAWVSVASTSMICGAIFVFATRSSGDLSMRFHVVRHSVYYACYFVAMIAVVVSNSGFLPWKEYTHVLSEDSQSGTKLELTGSSLKTPDTGSQKSDSV